MAKFYLCEHCGNIVEKIQDSGVPLVCCGQPMKELTPNTVEASTEKHLPVVSFENGTVSVKVGSLEHPMMEEHYIQWIYLETGKGFYRKELKPGDRPEVIFHIGSEIPCTVYAYCNIHGLWKSVF